MTLYPLLQAAAATYNHEYTMAWGYFGVALFAVVMCLLIWTKS